MYRSFNIGLWFDTIKASAPISEIANSLIAFNGDFTMSDTHIETEKIYRLIHELNNALNIIKMNAYLLRGKLREHAEEESLHSLQSGVEKAEKVLKDFCLVEMGQIDAKQSGEK